MDIQRKAFEHWFSEEFRCNEWAYDPFSRIEFNDIDAYSCSTVNAAWSAWQAAKAQAVPEGFVVVPKEPTKEMRVGGAVAWCRNEGVHDIYKAMIEAQEPPQP